MKAIIKFQIFMILFGLSPSVYASNLCPNMKSNTDKELHMLETDFSKQNALNAIKSLHDFIVAPGKSSDFEILMRRKNNQLIIRLYFLFSDAKKENSGNMDYKGKIKEYCTFLKNEASWVE